MAVLMLRPDPSVRPAVGATAFVLAPGSGPSGHRSFVSVDARQNSWAAAPATPDVSWVPAGRRWRPRLLARASSEGAELEQTIAAAAEPYRTLFTLATLTPQARLTVRGPRGPCVLDSDRRTVAAAERRSCAPASTARSRRPARQPDVPTHAPGLRAGASGPDSPRDASVDAQLPPRARQPSTPGRREHRRGRVLSRAPRRERHARRLRPRTRGHPPPLDAALTNDLRVRRAVRVVALPVQAVGRLDRTVLGDDSSSVAEVAPSRRWIAAIDVSGLTTSDPSSRCSTTTYSPERSPLRVAWAAPSVLIGSSVARARGPPGLEARWEALVAGIDSTRLRRLPRCHRCRRNLHRTLIHRPLPRPYKQGVTGSRPVPPIREAPANFRPSEEARFSFPTREHAGKRQVLRCRFPKSLGNHGRGSAIVHRSAADRRRRRALYKQEVAGSIPAGSTHSQKSYRSRYYSLGLRRPRAGDKQGTGNSIATRSPAWGLGRHRYRPTRAHRSPPNGPPADDSAGGPPFGLAPPYSSRPRNRWRHHRQRFSGTEVALLPGETQPGAQARRYPSILPDRRCGPAG